MRLLSTIVAAALGPLAALAADPEVSVTRLANLPSRLFYFDDTPVRAPKHHVWILADMLGRLDAGSSDPQSPTFSRRGQDLEPSFWT
jgi:hypothetical protein